MDESAQLFLFRLPDATPTTLGIVDACWRSLILGVDKNWGRGLIVERPLAI
jgi:hypothetical protein